MWMRHVVCSHGWVLRSGVQACSLFPACQYPCSRLSRLDMTADERNRHRVCHLDLAANCSMKCEWIQSSKAERLLGLRENERKKEWKNHRIHRIHTSIEKTSNNTLGAFILQDWFSTLPPFQSCHNQNHSPIHLLNTLVLAHAILIILIFRSSGNPVASLPL